ncbi:uncharacterized protein LOC123316087 [Coccinella septempunctata]|uniref:uncharacterized protein LOC123316087 n=1 Tax=Coccinella septempunctata TaxID=41139 RepID=UPI001D065B26|nr:uncharacterized protein LOC123316087 [Coccinella septempunctata]
MSALCFTSNIVKIFGVPCNSRKFISFNHRLLFRRELLVPTFCNIVVDIPFNINLKPLDVHKYQNCNRIFVELTNFKENQIEEPLIVDQNKNNIYIKSSVLKDLTSEDVTCNIVAPIKANLNIHSNFGNISIKNFNGEKVLASSKSGDIAVEGFQGKEIDVKTSIGDVTFRGVIQSSSIKVQVLEKGSVSINKLLGEDTCIATKYGNICVESSYCNRSKFMTENGDMNLRNIHKHCEVIHQNSGNVNITSLDGQLLLKQESGNADIHLSRITEDSEIKVLNGNVLLRLSEECQDKNKFNIQSKSININPDVNIKQIHPEDATACDSETHNHRIVWLNCQNSSVNIEAASWFDMNFNRKSDLE